MCFDVALSAASNVLHVVFGIDVVGGVRINRSSTKHVAAILDDCLDLTIFDPNLRKRLRPQTAGSCQPFDR